MHAANAPTPGTTRPSASIASWRVAGEGHLRAGALERAHGRTEVARPVVEDGDAGDDVGLRAMPLVEGTPGLARVERDRVAQRAGDGLELRLDDVVRVATAEDAHVQRDLGVVRQRLEDVAGQRAEVPRRCRRW